MPIPTIADMPPADSPQYNRRPMAKRKRSRPDEGATEFETIAFRVPRELADSSRAACYWARVKFVEFGRAALEREVKRLERAHNRGKPFSKPPAA
jgi:hypothetical protein